MGSTELAANLFRATQTDEKLRKENILGKKAANQTHYEVGKKVRQTIKELGGTMPEDLPTPTKGIKQIEREQRKFPKRNKNRPGAATPGTVMYIRRYTAFHQKYCIIFGTASQAEHPFQLAVIFVPIFQYNTKGR